MSRSLVLLAGLVVSFFAASAHAEEAVLGQLYGNGVHAYFAGDYAKAYDQLAAAVDGGSRDPRVFYFRGFSYLQLGREQEALQDFQHGAKLESKDMNRTYNVARSLERIQGSLRKQLESYRVEARLAATVEANQVRKAKFEAIQREEERVLKSQAEKGGPFNAGGERAATAPATEEKKPAAAEENPLPDEPEMKPAENPDEAGGFGSGEEKPAAKEKSPVKKSIFKAIIKGGASSLKESVNKTKGMIPGGKGGPMGPGPGMMPQGQGMPGPQPGGSDVFGSGDEEKPADPEKKDAEKESPFKEESGPAEKPDSADPFGNG
jgi:hypothetical protein